MQAEVEPTLIGFLDSQHDQFECRGYFVTDLVDHSPGKPVFNLAVDLKDSWRK
jgi:glutaminyl-tRNA synthetase